MGTLVQNLKVAVRMLTKNPAFTAAAVLTLALGIGMNTAVFSAVHALLLRPLPGVHQPDDLVQLFRTWPGGFLYGSNSIPHFFDVRDRNEVYDGVAAWNFVPLSLSAEGRSERIMGEMVSANFFQVLGVNAIRGRTFLQEEEGHSPGAHPVVVLSHRLWQSRFGEDPEIVGRTLIINGQPWEVIGVAPEGFTGPMPAVSAALWAPLLMQEQLMPGYSFLESRGNNFLFSFARLKEGVTFDQAQESMDRLVGQLREVYPEHYENSGILAFPQKDAGIHPMFRTAQLGMSAVMMVVVALLLLIACVNVANLFLARAQDRKKEMGIRLSLGARRGRLIGQLLTESMLFALLAGGVGILFAYWAIGIAARIPFPMEMTIDWGLSIDGPVLLFTLGAAMFAGILFGLVPALQASKPETVSALKGEISPEGGAGSRMSRSLVVVQMALSLLLLISAGLFLQNLRGATAIDKGFNSDNLLMATADPGLQGYERERTVIFFRELVARTEAMPGVESVGLSSLVPLSIGGSDRGVGIPGYEPLPNEFMSIMYNYADQGYFAAMGIPFLEGRAFSDADVAEDASSIIVNQRFVERFWPGESAIGKIVRAGGQENRVVGVVPTGKYRSLGEDPEAYMYLPWPEWFSSDMTIHIRTAGNPEALAPLVRQEIQSMDPYLPVYDVKTMDSHLGIAMLPARLGGTALGVFGVLGLILAAVGIYGVMSYAVSQRTREIGIRVALGADRGQVTGMVLWQGARIVIIGVVVGLAGALGAAQLIRSQLYSQSGIDPITFVGVPLILAAVALLATYLPARKAATVDPIQALKYE